MYVALSTPNDCLRSVGPALPAPLDSQRDWRDWERCAWAEGLRSKVEFLPRHGSVIEGCIYGVVVAALRIRTP